MTATRPHLDQTYLEFRRGLSENWRKKQLLKKATTTFILRLLEHYRL